MEKASEGELEIRPEPAAEERAALLAALALRPRPRAGEHTAWWALGVRENLEEGGRGSP